MNSELAMKIKTNCRLNYLFREYWIQKFAPMIRAGKSCFWGTSPIVGEQGPTNENSLPNDGIPYKYYDYSISRGEWKLITEGKAVAFTGEGCNCGAFIINEDGSKWQYDHPYYGQRGFFGHCGGIRLEIGDKRFGGIGDTDCVLKDLRKGMKSILPMIDHLTLEIFFRKRYTDEFAKENAA